MTKLLLEHINKFIKLNVSDYKEIIDFFDLRYIRKKEIIAGAGKRCQWNHFVLKGCLQMFFINDKGMERTVQFAIENWWMTDCLAFHNQKTSNFNIQAVEDTQILSITYDNQIQLLNRFPILEKYFRIIYQISFGATQMRMKYLYDYTKEEKYFDFVDKYPEFAQRIPQYMLASYLGLTPEYVSEIKKNRS